MIIQFDERTEVVLARLTEWYTHTNIYYDEGAEDPPTSSGISGRAVEADD